MTEPRDRIDLIIQKASHSVLPAPEVKELRAYLAARDAKAQPCACGVVHGDPGERFPSSPIGVAAFGCGCRTVNGQVTVRCAAHADVDVSPYDPQSEPMQWANDDAAEAAADVPEPSEWERKLLEIDANRRAGHRIEGVRPGDDNPLAEGIRTKLSYQDMKRAGEVIKELAESDDPEMTEVSNVGPSMSGGGVGPPRLDPETGRYYTHSYPLPDDPRDLPDDHRTWNDDMIRYSNGEIVGTNREAFVVLRSAGDYGDYYVEVKALFNNRPAAEDYAKAGQVVDTAERSWSGGGWHWEVHPVAVRRAAYLADQNVDPEDDEDE